MDTILEVINVNKKFKNFSLEDFSFEVKEGRILGFIGRNGAGKTTTLKGIMNLLHFDSGEVFFLGQNMKTYEKEAKQEIGFSLSELNYYPDKSIASMVDVVKRFYKDFSEEKFDKLTELFSLDKKKKLKELSSGMKVKYSLALALSHNAKLLILDEPTSGLDPISRDEILDIFKSIVKDGKRSIIFSTHITSDLDKCADDILYIKEGKKVYEGGKDEFINSYSLISGPLNEYRGAIERLSISCKKERDDFHALISARDLKNIKTGNLKIEEPDLEEIMVYFERGKNHEEFVL